MRSFSLATHAYSLFENFGILSGCYGNLLRLATDTVRFIETGGIITVCVGGALLSHHKGTTPSYFSRRWELEADFLSA